MNNEEVRKELQMGLKYSQVKEIYKRAKWLIYANLYDERSLARDMVAAAQLTAQLTAARAVISAFVYPFAPMTPEQTEAIRAWRAVNEGTDRAITGNKTDHKGANDDRN